MTQRKRPVGNPLLDPPLLPFGAPAFDRIEPRHFAPAFRFLLAEARGKIDEIKFNPALPTFKNTVEALEYATTRLDQVKELFQHYAGSNITKAIERLAAPVEMQITRFYDEMMQDEVLFARVNAIKKSATATAALEPDQKVLLDTVHRMFIVAGVDLPPEKKEQLKDLNVKLAKQTAKFMQNLTDGAAAWQYFVTDESRLKGVPEDAKQGFAERAAEKGKPGQWLIEIASADPVLACAEDRTLREAVWRADNSACAGGAFDNHATILKMIQLRHDIARVSGFDNYAAYTLQDRMLDTPAKVMAMLDADEAAYRPAALKERAALEAYSGLGKDFQPWDTVFYKRKMKEELFKIDAEEVRQYFKLENVLAGAFLVAEKLFGLKFTETIGQYPVDVPDIKVFEARNVEGGNVVGLLYIDPYARPGTKAEGAWAYQLRSAMVNEHGLRLLPVASNDADLPKPPAGRPMLLHPSEASGTIFHEFFHGLHVLLGKSRYPSLASFSVPYDFIEVPSQFGENFLMEPAVLDVAARHHETGTRIPQEMVDKLQAAQNFGAGAIGLHQTYMAKLDMAWHMTDPSTIKSVEDFEDKVLKSMSLRARVPGTSTSSWYHHLFGSTDNYAAGYYSYRNASGIEAAMMEKMRASGDALNPVLGRELREGIYGQGAMQEPEKLARDFLGGDPDPAALYRREGILPPAPQAPEKNQQGPENSKGPSAHSPKIP